jgi:zinc transport system permease protein
MAIWAALLGAAAAPLGLIASLNTDAPAGPCIVLAAGALFAVTALASAISSSALVKKAR